MYMYIVQYPEIAAPGPHDKYRRVYHYLPLPLAHDDVTDDETLK